MADNPSKSSFSTLTTKQKVIGALTIVIFGFIIYEVFGLFSTKTAETPITPSPPPAQSVKHMTGNMPQTASSTNSAMNMNPQNANPTMLTPVSAITPPKEIIDPQKQIQQQQNYLDSVNQLQLLKVKREIAETNQAIASARLATETANKNMSELLTQPSLPQLPGGVETTKPAMLTGAPGQPSIENPPIALKAQVADIPFTVISVSMKFSRWNAVLSYQNKLYSVVIGDTLFDGSMVAGINKNGIVLLKDGKRRKVSVQSTI